MFINGKIVRHFLMENYSFLAMARSSGIAVHAPLVFFSQSQGDVPEPIYVDRPTFWSMRDIMHANQEGNEDAALWDVD